MKVTQQKKPVFVPKLLNALGKYYEERAKERLQEVHISDLILCPREALFRKLDPKEIEERELANFFSGESCHVAAQQLAVSEKECEIEKEVKYDGCFGHVDIYAAKENIPIELKTFRGKAENLPKDFQIKQLTTYMAILGSKVGYILYYLMMKFSPPQFTEYKVELTDDDIKKELDWLDTNNKIFKIAMDKKDPALAPHIFYNKNLNWKCGKTHEATGKYYKNCKYYDECEKMRNAELKIKWDEGKK